MAMSWLVYKLTGSAILLGVIDFSSQFSAFLLMPIAGVLLDSFNLRKSLLITQSLGLIQALLLWLMTATGTVNFGNLVLVSVFLGMINAFDMPGRQAFTYHLIDKKEDLVNAIALNSSLFNSARLIGPAVAGLLVAALGEEVCFFVNALSFVPIVFILWSLKINVQRVKRRKPPFWEGLTTGLRYAFHNTLIAPILGLCSLSSFIGMSYIVLLPVFARDVLGGGPQTLGFLMGANGLGALIGALYLASRKDLSRLDRMVPTAFGLLGIGVVMFARVKGTSLAMLLMIFNGFWMITGWSASNTLLQTEVEEDKRARVMSLYTMSFMGMAPLGSLLQGYFSQKWGIINSLTLSGTLCFAASAIFYLIRFGTANKTEWPSH